MIGVMIVMMVMFIASGPFWVLFCIKFDGFKEIKLKMKKKNFS